MRAGRFVCFALVSLLLGCESASGGGEGWDGPTAAEVVRFEPGVGAGHGQAAMPDVALDLAPPGAQTVADVVSLGDGGLIELRFVGVAIVDGEGPDLLVVENVFLSSGASEPYTEVATVSVSDGGEEWHDLPFDYVADGQTPAERFAGFAGVRVGGDSFDLADVGLARATHVRIRDAGALGPPDSRMFDLDGEFLDDAGNECCEGSSQGFDLDGIVALNWE